MIGRKTVATFLIIVFFIWLCILRRLPQRNGINIDSHEQIKVADNSESTHYKTEKMSIGDGYCHLKQCGFTVLCTNLRTVYPTLVLFNQLRRLHPGQLIKLTVVCPASLWMETRTLFEALQVEVSYLPKSRLVQPQYPLTSTSTRKRDLTLWNKLYAWNLTSFDKIIMLDADMVILKPLTDLFDIEAQLAGVPSLDQDEKTLFWDPPDPFEADSNDPAAWRNFTKPTQYHLHHTGLNGGLMLLRPDPTTFKELVAAAHMLKERTCCPTQEFIYRFFELRNQYQRLLPIYNMRKYHKLQPEGRPALEDIKVYHFVEKQKPWLLGRMASRNHKFAALWWKAAEETDLFFEGMFANNEEAKSLIRYARHEAILSTTKEKS